ncbi:MAG: type III-B CRISPR module-associated protein Cmr3 [Thermodesulfobacteriota bacterium]
MGADEIKVIGLEIMPLDTLFFRDGRPFGEAVRASSGLPQPQTLAGALRTWLLRQAGCDFEALAQVMAGGAGFGEALAQGQPPAAQAVADATFRGPWLYRDQSPMAPLPATILKTDGGEYVRLDPLAPETLPGWRPPMAGMQPLWRRGDKPAKHRPAFLTMTGLRQFLAGGVPQPAEVIAPECLYGFDERVGIGVDPQTYATEEGMIYAARMLAPKEGVGFYAEVRGPQEVLALLPNGPFPLAWGGEGRRAACRKVPAVGWPEEHPRQGEGALLLLTAPGLFPDGWRPPEVKPVAAAVSDSVAVSGWDLARGGPKPNRFAVAAGSVYFLKQPLRRGASLCQGEDATVGWGTFVEGRWNYA